MSNVDITQRILADKRARLARGDYAAGPAIPPRAPSDGARFVASLSEPGPRIVAEIKAKSPSAGEILAGADGKVETFALLYRRGHAAAISVVVEEDHFGGRPDWLPRAKDVSGLPVLMKDFVVDDRQLDFAVALGADAVLLIVRVLSDGKLSALATGARKRNLAVVAEAHDEAEIARAAAIAPDVIGVNSRNLATFETDIGRLESLARTLPSGPIALAESGIRGRDDIDRLTAAGYRSFLIGEHLLRSEDPQEFLRTLRP
jgi:indole-3-glycerol phosphate synthase